MDIVNLLKDKTVKATEKTTLLADEFITGGLVLSNVIPLIPSLKDPSIALILAAMESATQSNPEISNEDYVVFLENYICAKSNSLKREAARIIGNIAHLYPDRLDKSIKLLLTNTNDEGTVIRWSSAYALSKILVIPQHANSHLYEKATTIFEEETKSSIKNMYAKALKNASKLR